MFLCIGHFLGWSEKTFFLDDVRILLSARMKIIMHFWALSGLRQSGCKSKKYLVDTSCFWTTKIHWKLCAVHHLWTNLILGSGKIGWKCKLWSGELGNMRYCHCKNIIWPPGAEVIILFWNIFKANAVSITFGLRYIHGQSLNEIDFPTRNVVGRF